MKCKKCKHQWTPRQNPKDVTNCPKCRKLLDPLPIGRQVGFKLKLDKNRRINQCFRCGYKWNPYSYNPRRCPRCSSEYWDKPRKR